MSNLFDNRTPEQWQIEANRYKMLLLKETSYYAKERLLIQYTYCIECKVKAENGLIPTVDAIGHPNLIS